MRVDKLISELEKIREKHGNIEIDRLKTLEDFTLGEKRHAVLTNRTTFTLDKENLP